MRDWVLKRDRAGLVLLLVGAFFLAGGCVSESIQPKPDWSIYYRLGLSHLWQAERSSSKGEALFELSRAYAELSRALELNPKEAQIYYAMGLVFKGRDDVPQAINYLEKALKLNPKFPEAHDALGAIYIGTGDFRKAIDEFNLALADTLYNTPELSYHKRGRAYAALREWDQAVKDYRKALEINYRFYQVHHDMGVALLEQGKVKEAIGQLKEAMRFSAPSPGLRYDLGLAYLRDNQVTEAIKELKEVVRMVPQEPVGVQAKSILDRLEPR